MALANFALKKLNAVRFQKRNSSSGRADSLLFYWIVRDSQTVQMENWRRLTMVLFPSFPEDNKNLKSHDFLNGFSQNAQP
jgi:hypothetical protein